MSVQMKPYSSKIVHQGLRITPKEVVEKKEIDMIGENN